MEACSSLEPVPSMDMEGPLSPSEVQETHLKAAALVSLRCWNHRLSDLKQRPVTISDLEARSQTWVSLAATVRGWVGRAPPGGSRPCPIPCLMAPSSLCAVCLCDLCWCCCVSFSDSEPPAPLLWGPGAAQIIRDPLSISEGPSLNTPCRVPFVVERGRGHRWA